MRIQTRAGLDTVLFVILIAVVTASTYFLLTWAGAAGVYTAIAGIAAVVLYTVYSINLARRQYLEDKNK